LGATTWSVTVTLLSVGLGGLITYLVSRMYYRRAATELKNESAELRRLTTLVLSAMEHAGLVSLARDKAGRITGFVIHVSPGSVSVTGGVGTLIASGEQPGEKPR
jgi:hypothetical protein